MRLQDRQENIKKQGQQRNRDVERKFKKRQGTLQPEKNFKIPGTTTWIKKDIEKNLKHDGLQETEKIKNLVQKTA